MTECVVCGYSKPEPAIYVIEKNGKPHPNEKDSRKIRAFSTRKRAETYMKNGEKVVKYIPEE